MFLSALPLKFREGLKDTEVTEGQSVTLKVKVTKKGSQVRWFRNGVQIKVDKRNKDVEMTQKQLFYHLTLHKVKASDGVEISATYADDETKCNLLVQGRVFSVWGKGITGRPNLSHNSKSWYIPPIFPSRLS